MRSSTPTGWKICSIINAAFSALSSGESDVKTLEELARSGDANACLALDVFAVSVRKTIGAYMALLGGVDLLVFTGGIGEHSSAFDLRQPAASILWG